jgi:putative RNA 2'-phosphotransferase
MTIETKISKTLSYWLRHKPDAAGLEVDAQGWTSVAAVLEAMDKDGLSVDRTLFDQVVADNNKQRFEYSYDGMQIRAEAPFICQPDGTFAVSCVNGWS